MPKSLSPNSSPKSHDALEENPATASPGDNVQPEALNGSLVSPGDAELGGRLCVCLLYVYICIIVCTHIYNNICVCIYIYISIHIYIHIHTQNKCKRNGHPYILLCNIKLYL